MNMFISKQFKNFVHSKAVLSIFCNCIFEGTRAKSMQISFSILEISLKKCVAYQKLNLLCSLAHEHERSFVKVSAIGFLRHDCFC